MRVTGDSVGGGLHDEAVTGSALDHFTSVTRQWFTDAFAAPTTAQEGAWRSIARGDNTLVVAPTGSGKTLAAFLWSLDRLAAERAATGVRAPGPERRARGCRVVYVSPLKALAVDVERNLRAPLTGLKQTARRLGLPVPEISVAIRSGDTAAGDRRRFAANPADILITTPESLYLLLTSRARDALREVETVIVDEVHAVAATKRGAHLALTLERLDALLPRPAQRIGLSATVRPVSEVAAFLGGARPTTVVQPPSEKVIEVKVIVPVEDMTELDGAPRQAAPSGDGESEWSPEPPARRSIWPHVEEHLLELIGSHRSTIVFANSRRLAERLCARLNELAFEQASLRAGPPGGDPGDAMAAESGSSPPGSPAASPPGLSPPASPGAFSPSSPPAVVMAQAGSAKGAVPEIVRAHHGSVSKEERAQIEEALKSGRLPAVVATSSLELGIDMGSVDLVACVEAPPSVASGLQRIGRAGHQVGAVSRGVIFPKYRGDLLQTAVVAERMGSGEIEEMRYPRNPLDVLAQQIVAMCALDEWTVDELETLIRRAAPYRDAAEERAHGHARHARRALSERGVRRAATPRRVGSRDRPRHGPPRSPAPRGHQRRHHPRPRHVRRLPRGRRHRQRRQAGGRARRGDGLRIPGGRHLRAGRHLMAHRGHHRRPGPGLARARPPGQAAVLARRRARPSRRAGPGARGVPARALRGEDRPRCGRPGSTSSPSATSCPISPSSGRPRVTFPTTALCSSSVSTTSSATGGSSSTLRTAPVSTRRGRSPSGAGCASAMTSTCRPCIPTTASCCASPTRSRGRRTDAGDLRCRRDRADRH